MSSKLPLKHRDPHIFKRQLLIHSFIVGILSGLASVAFRWTLSQIAPLRKALYSQADGGHLLILLGLVFAGSYILVKLLHWAPYSGGSGIPQIKAEIMNQLNDRPLPTLISKFVGGAVNNLIGYSVGREGPSIQMGGMVAKWWGQVQGLDGLQLKYLTTAGASAGLSAAFNAPLAGVLFSLEEMYGSMSHVIVIPCVIASIVANYISFTLLGFESSFSFRIQSHLGIEHLPSFIILGILCGIVGVTFNQGRILLKSLMDQIKVSKLVMVTAVSLLVMLVGFLIPDLQAGGHHLIEELTHNPYSLWLILGLLIGKLVLTLICFNSGVQGGIFLPVLVLGALSGALYYQVNLAGMVNQDALVNYLILGMAGVLASVVRAPILSIVLVTEMTGTLSHLLAISTVVMTALFTAEALKCLPVYESLYDELVLRLRGDQQTVSSPMMISDFTVTQETNYVGVPLKVLAKPSDFIVVEIIRDRRHFIPTAKDHIQVFDTISVLHPSSDTAKIHEFFQG